MLPDDCKNCKKPKTIFFTQIVDGKIKKFDLCADCPHAAAVNDPAGFGLAEQLTAAGVEMKESETGQAHACPNCGFTIADFRKTGRLGCPQCYDTFFHSVEAIIRPMHRGMRHKGKVPKLLEEELKLRQSVVDMEEQLQDAVKREDYEKAAELRDSLRDFEQRLASVTGGEDEPGAQPPAGSR